MLAFALISCAAIKVQEQNQDTNDSFTYTDDTESEGQETEVSQGALVTSDCLFEGYTYAIDILLSCGDERFDDVLRLHTFKRHSHDHSKIFNDQLITYKNRQLWFDAYDIPRCIEISNNKLYLSTSENECSNFELVDAQQNYFIREVETETCITLGISSCEQHQSTEGESVEELIIDICPLSCLNVLKHWNFDLQRVLNHVAMSIQRMNVFDDRNAPQDRTGMLWILTLVV